MLDGDKPGDGGEPKRDFAVTVTDFLDWKRQAKPRQRFAYHRGFLACDVAADFASGIIELHPVRRAAIDGYLTGEFELVQQRHGNCDYTYYIVRRRVRDTASRRWYLGKDWWDIRRESQPGEYASDWPRVTGEVDFRGAFAAHNVAVAPDRRKLPPSPPTHVPTISAMAFE